MTALASTGLFGSKQRSIIVKARWAGKEVSLRSDDDGATYLAGTGEPGVILVIQCTAGKFVARLEHRVRGNSWAGEVRRSIPLAIASLQHEVKMICRAGNVRAGG